MSPSNEFELFGTAHLTTICVILAVALVLPLGVRFLVPIARRPVAYFLAAILLVQEGIRVWMHVSTQGLSPNLLPLQLCTLAIYLSAWMLISQDRRIFEVIYFWGLGGTTQALLTPDLEEGFPTLSFIAFFVGHGAVIVSICYAMIAMRFRPFLIALPRVIAITAVFAAVAFLMNLWLDTNFMYLMAKPLRPSLLDWFGPWPWYLLSAVIMGLIFFALLYSPFFVFDRVNRRSSFEPK